MDHHRLGRTALRVSAVALGTMNFGPRTAEHDAFAMLDRALDAGVNLIDTADQYGGELGVGATESLLGRWLAQGDGRRDRIVLATKVHEPMSDEPNDRGLSAHHIRRACEASLRRLGTDHIDLYQMHHIDRAAHWDEIWQAMDTLVAQGKVSYVGSSNFAGWHLAQANERAAARNSLGIVSEQSLYHLAERSIELEVLPACESYGIGVLPWSPLGGGLLAASDPSGDRRAHPQLQARVDAIRPQLDAYLALCADLGASPSQVALAWLCHQPAVTAPIIGPRTMEQLDDALGAASVDLDEATLTQLDAIFPGPGPAPEAYAW